VITTFEIIGSVGGEFAFVRCDDLVSDTDLSSDFCGDIYFRFRDCGADTSHRESMYAKSFDCCAGNHGAINPSGEGDDTGRIIGKPVN
jgi:hypothetical protein